MACLFEIGIEDDNCYVEGLSYGKGYVSLESELVAELPHPVYYDCPAQPTHVLLVLLYIARVDQVLLLFLAEDLK